MVYSDSDIVREHGEYLKFFHKFTNIESHENTTFVHC